LKRYPESDYAIGATDYFIGRGAALDSLGVRTAAYFFVKAEEYLLTFNRIDSALANYQIVIDTFETSRYRPKAFAAQAYIYERKTYNSHLAESLYQFISDSFPGSNYSQLAQVRLGKAAPTFEKEVPPELAADSMKLAMADSSRKTDSGRQSEKSGRSPSGSYIDPVTGKELPRAPYPRYPIELRYPQSDWKSDLQGQVVRVKIQIDPFGQARDAVLLATCGSNVIDQAALMAVKQTEWKPEDIPIEYLGGWFYFEVPVEKPKMTIDRDRGQGDGITPFMNQ
jgi:TonB family protein